MMIKKLISIVLSLSLILASSSMSFAVEAPNTFKDSFATSTTGYMDVEIEKLDTTKYSLKNNISFKISQYDNNQLTQTVTGQSNAEELIVTNYRDGVIINEDIINLSERIVKNSTTLNDVNSEQHINKRSDFLGYITYNNIYVSGNERIKVYSDFTISDTESYTINGEATDTLAVITGIIISVLSIFSPLLKICEQIAVAIISAAGGSVLGGAIGVFFSEDVAVNAYYYDLTGYDYSTGRYSQIHSGVSRHVLTNSSSYAGEWLHENFTPYNWKDNTLAYWFWCDLFSLEYPQVKSYS